MIQPLAKVQSTLSKSDFKVGRSCPQKLVYKKKGYPSREVESDFMKLLVEGGFIIGKLAQLLYPGTLITGTTEEALAETDRLLKSNDSIILHEAAIKSGQFLVRIDILKKEGTHLQVIEVKSKSFNGESEEDDSEKNNKIAYEEDALFQAMVLQDAYPDAKVEACLLMANKDARTQIEGLAGWFKIIEETNEAGLSQCRVEFIYENHPQRDQFLDQLRNDNIIREDRALVREGAERLQQIRMAANKMLAIINNDLKCAEGDVVLSKACKKCEFRATKSNPLDGYSDCWGALAKVSPHIFDLYYGGLLGKYQLLNTMIAERKVSLYDFNESHFVGEKGNIGSRNERQIIQYRGTKAGKEWNSDRLHQSLCDLEYPLHFIDFETYTGAIPFHEGMSPYEPVIFQWSCHTIEHEGAQPIHKEWINTDQDFPNFKFAEALMAWIGNRGTPLMWSHHENTMLNKIIEQMAVRNYSNPALLDWLITMTTAKDEKKHKTIRKGRLVDMDKLTVEHYFHPSMKGQTSIKKTLPAVWNHHPYLHEIEWFKPYVVRDEHGEIMDPYYALKANGVDAESAEAIAEGGAAMKAYWEMMWGDPAKKEILKNQLLKYCELDTMAMVIIWTHWCHIASLKNQKS